MKARTLTSLLFVIITLIATTAQSVPILLGKVVPGSPAAPDYDVLYINGVIDAVEGTYSGGTPGVGGSYIDQISSQDHTFTAFTSAAVGTYGEVDPLTTAGADKTGTITGWQYVLGKYGDISVVWYLGGETFTVPENVVLPDGGSTTVLLQQSLSHYQAYNSIPTSVPDGASTAVLFGLALSLLSLFRWKTR